MTNRAMTSQPRHPAVQIEIFTAGPTTYVIQTFYELDARRGMPTVTSREVTIDVDQALCHRTPVERTGSVRQQGRDRRRPWAAYVGRSPLLGPDGAVRKFPTKKSVDLAIRTAKAECPYCAQEFQHKAGVHIPSPRFGMVSSPCLAQPMPTTKKTKQVTTNMSGIHDGVSKIWIMRTRGGLDIDGFATPVDAITHIVRGEMVQDDSPQNKANIRKRVEEALRHMDDKGGG